MKRAPDSQCEEISKFGFFSWDWAVHSPETVSVFSHEDKIGVSIPIIELTENGTAKPGVLQHSIGVVKGCEVDPMARSNRLNRLDPICCDKPSTLRERFEVALQGKSYAF